MTPAELTSIGPKHCELAVAQSLSLKSRRSWHGGHICPHGRVTLMTGGMVATTHTWKLQLEVLPEVSLAVQVSLVQPSGKLVPDGGEQVTTATPQLSDALGMKLAMAP